MFDGIVDFIKNNICFIMVLFGYNLIHLIILLLLGNTKIKGKENTELYEDNKYIKYVGDYKHIGRNLYQNFKFKLDCIVYSFIVIIYCLLKKRNSIENIYVVIILLIFILAIKVFISLLILLLKHIEKVGSSIKSFMHRNLLNIIILFFIVFLIYIIGKIELKTVDSNLIISIFTALFVWGLVEYMSFRYDIIRDVIIERDELINSILNYIFDELNNNKRNSNSNCKKYSDVLDVISSIGSKQKYYCLTQEYDELYNLITKKLSQGKIKSKKEMNKVLNEIRNEVISIQKEYTKERVEFWYYNVLEKAFSCRYKNFISKYNNVFKNEDDKEDDSIKYYSYDGESIKNIYDFNNDTE